LGPRHNNKGRPTERSATAYRPTGVMGPTRARADAPLLRALANRTVCGRCGHFHAYFPLSSLERILAASTASMTAER